MVSLDSCEKDTIPGPASPPDPANSILPLRIGNRWVIQSIGYDTSGAVAGTQLDTFYVERDTIIQNELWYIGFGGIVTNRADGLYDYYAPSSSPTSLKFMFPVSAPRSYSYRGIAVQVLSTTDTVSVQAGSFTCYLYRIGNDTIYHYHYYSPGTGFIKSESFSPFFGKVRKKSESKLVSYDLQ